METRYDDVLQNGRILHHKHYVKIL